MSDQLYLVTNMHLLLATIYPKHQNNIFSIALYLKPPVLTTTSHK